MSRLRSEMLSVTACVIFIATIAQRSPASTDNAAPSPQKSVPDAASLIAVAPNFFFGGMPFTGFRLQGYSELAMTFDVAVQAAMNVCHAIWFLLSPQAWSRS